VIGPSYGYYPEPDKKSILIMRPENKANAKIEFADLGFKVTTGSRYLGGFIGEEDNQDEWLEELTEKWTSAIGELVLAAKLYPQFAYCGLNKSLQQEWHFIQRVCEGISGSFTGVKEALVTEFLPALFGESVEPNRMICMLVTLPIKQAGLALPDPKETAGSRHAVSKEVCLHLLSDVLGEVDFSLEEH
jgi:hypothetical protein